LTKEQLTNGLDETLEVFSMLEGHLLIQRGRGELAEDGVGLGERGEGRLVGDFEDDSEEDLSWEYGEDGRSEKL
jgi:hypothetical protein